MSPMSQQLTLGPTFKIINFVPDYCRLVLVDRDHLRPHLRPGDLLIIADLRIELDNKLRTAYLDNHTTHPVRQKPDGIWNWPLVPFDSCEYRRIGCHMWPRKILVKKNNGPLTNGGYLIGIYGASFDESQLKATPPEVIERLGGAS